jgi:hypothetical protein
MTITSPTTTIADFWEWDRLARANGWTDGLVVAPPTREVVEALLAAWPGPDTLGPVPPGMGVATAEQVAIQCAMAGCLPEHLPVVVAALRAMQRPEFNLYGVQCTSNSVFPLTIVNGPIVAELGFNTGRGALGGCAQPDAVIGRAVRLVLWNLGRGTPKLSMAPLAHPGQYSFCMAENAAANPWGGMHTDAGLAPDTNAVTVFACQPPYRARTEGDPDLMLRRLGRGLASPTINMFNAAGEVLVVLSPNPADILADAGYAKADVREALWRYASMSVGELKDCGAWLGQDPNDAAYWSHESLADRRPSQDAPDDERLPMVESPDKIHIAVTGGVTRGVAALCPGWGNYGGIAVTEPIAD